MSIADYIFYFQTLAKAHDNLQGFFFMNESRLKSFQPSEIDYPILMLEVPTIFYSGDSQDLKKVFKGSFSILANTLVDDEIYQDFVSNECETIAKDFIQKILDSEKFIVEANDISCECVRGFTHDNLYGWRVMFSLEVSVSNCELDVWNDDILAELAEETILQFTFENAKKGSFDINLAVINPTNFDSLVWEVLVDDKPVKVKNDKFTAKGEKALVKLKATKNNIVFYSIAYIRSIIYSGEGIRIR